MTPRADEPPRRGTPPRRGAARDLPPERDSDTGRGFGGIGDARAYTPRGRTVAERDQRTRSPHAGRTTDPFRPALQVLDGGETAGRARRRGLDDAEPPAARRKRDDAEPPPARRGRDDAEPPATRRGRDDAEPPATRRKRSAAADPASQKLPKARGGRKPAAEPATQRRAGSTTESGRQRRPAPAGAPAPTRSAVFSRTRSAAGGRSENRSRTGRDRTVASAAAPRRTAGGRPGASARSRRSAAAVPAAPPKLASGTRRLRLATVLALTLFVTIGIRLVVLQVVESPDEAERLLEQRQSRLTEVVLPAPRGSILDRSGAVLAHSVEARYIYADPELVQDPAGTALKLSPLLGIAPSRLLQLMTKKKRPGGGWSRFEYLARGVDIAVADQIAAMNLPGIRADRDERRDVPGADLAANLIGFTGEDHIGLEGLEARYDGLLRGTDGEKVYETGNPNAGHGELAKEIPGGYHRETPAQPGTSLTLTIDRDLQFEVQRYLSDDMRQVHATIGAAVVLDVRTGEVLAQASYPAYNAAKPFDARPVDREDVASSVVADPGSSHKPFVLGAALQEGIITPDSTITVGPALMRGGYRFQDTHPQPRGTKLTVPGVLAYSSNVGTILIGDKLGPKRIYEYQQKFGLGHASGEGMPGEATGRILAPDEWSGSASGSVPIGMSVDATLVQMTAAYAAIANNGMYVQPHLIRSTIAPDGTVTPAPAPETHEVLSPTVASQLRTMMEAVVDVQGATGTRAAVAGYRVAGKTGTGKRLIKGKYTRYNAGSFVGMAPADNPRFVIGVFADVPNGTGGTVAAPAFSKMMSFALAHYRVPPSGTKPPKFRIHP
jgi:cell division protein FtsI (penicillin-binding protein 3)